MEKCWKMFEIFVLLLAIPQTLQKFIELRANVELENIPTDNEPVTSFQETDKAFSYDGFEDSIRKKDSLYYKEASQRYNELKHDFRENFNSEYEALCPEIVQYIIDEWFPYYPLCSAEQIKKFGILRDSTSTAENWHKIVKINLNDEETKMPAPRFIKRQAELLVGRLRERTISLKTDRQKKGVIRKKIMKKTIRKYKFKNTSTYQNREGLKAHEFWLKKKFENKNQLKTEEDFEEENLLTSEEKVKENFEDRENKTMSKLFENQKENECLIFNKKTNIKCLNLKQTKEIKGYAISTESFKELKNNGLLDDNIINAFLAVQVDKVNNEVETIFKSVIPLIQVIADLNKSKFNIKEWRFYAPDDLPQQDDGVNSGTYVCVWGYMICRKLNIKFRNAEVKEYARKNILSMLMNAETDDRDDEMTRNRNRLRDEILKNRFTQYSMQDLTISIEQKPVDGFQCTAHYLGKISK
ncbi:hypothetical protein KQX54_000240 [Cotesia glomerata]|uniref:Uncharacterized protein n=1 Tax=Cotesia glomerata TaxID=32391 RepID=A0AAV7IR27_COTGL|nr:hypothetical protein KQX54_000240 [Cotesia glomerata]